MFNYYGSRLFKNVFHIDEFAGCQNLMFCEGKIIILRVHNYATIEVSSPTNFIEMFTYGGIERTRNLNKDSRTSMGGVAVRQTNFEGRTGNDEGICQGSGSFVSVRMIRIVGIILSLTLVVGKGLLKGFMWFF